MKMKQNILLVAAVVTLSVTACVTESISETKAEYAPYRYTAVNADYPSTRTILQSDGKVFWDTDEEICVFSGTTPFRFKGVGSAAAASMDFVGAESDMSLFAKDDGGWAVYPYVAAQSCDGPSVTVGIVASQKAVANSFDDDLFVTVAQSAGNQLSFYNVCGGLRFSLTEENVTRIVFSGNDGEVLAGNASVTFNGGLPTVSDVSSPATELVLTCENEEVMTTGTWYYIVSLPATLSHGYTMKLYKTDGTVAIKSGDKPVSIKRAIWGTLSGVDATLEYTQPNNEIWYTTTDANAIVLSRPGAFGAGVVSNTYKDGRGVIKFESDITSIGNGAFSDCSTLQTIRLPGTIVTIDNYAFNYCSALTSVQIPPAVRTIGFMSFYACKSLNSIQLPPALEMIGADSFGFSGLTTIDIPQSVTNLQSNAFTGCDKMSSFTGKFATDDGRSIVVGNELLAFAPAGLTEYVVPNGVEIIRDGVFTYNRELVSLTLPEGLKEIGWQCFAEAIKLKTINIPSTVNTIGGEAFRSTALEGTITIPDGLEYLGDAAFAGCDISAFYGKYSTSDHLALIVDGTLMAVAVGSGISEYEIPNTVKKIGKSAFYGITNIRSITIPNSVETIGASSFSKTSFVEIVVSSSVTLIERMAFGENSSLRSITFLSETPPVVNDGQMFYSTDNCFIYVPAASVSSYKAAPEWSSYSSRIKALDGSDMTTYDKLWGDWVLHAKDHNEKDAECELSINGGFSEEERLANKDKTLVCWGIAGYKDYYRYFGGYPVWYISFNEASHELAIKTGTQMTDPGLMTWVAGYQQYLRLEYWNPATYEVIDDGSVSVPGTWSDDFNTMTFDPDCGILGTIYTTSNYYLGYLFIYKSVTLTRKQ